jgi:hypothetical protein
LKVAISTMSAITAMSARMRRRASGLMTTREP